MQVQYTKTLLSVATAIVLGLSGCGGGGDSSSSTTQDTTTNTENTDSSTESTATATTISGKAVDGYLQEAIVCLDLDLNGNCNLSTEPTANTDAQGGYTLSVTSEQTNHPNYYIAPIIAYGGIDTDTGKRFEGFLTAPNDGSAINITPLTTLVQKQVEVALAEGSVTKEELESKVAEVEQKVREIFDLPEDTPVDADPIALQESGNDDLLSASLSLQKTVQTLAAAATDENESAQDVHEEIYSALAKALENVDTSEDGIAALVEEAAQNDLPQEAIEVKDVAIEIAQKTQELLEADFDSKDISTLIEQDILQIEAVLAEDGNVSDINITSAEDVPKDMELVRKEALEFEITNVLGLELDENDLESLIEKLPSDFDVADLYTQTDLLKEIDEDLYTSVLKIKQEWEQEDQTASDNSGTSLELPLTVYSYYTEWENDHEELHAEEITFLEDYSLAFKEFVYDLNSSTWEERDDSGDLILTANGWIDENEILKQPGERLDDGTIVLADGAQLQISGPYDISGDFFIPEVNVVITLPEGSQNYLVQLEFPQQYKIWDVERNYETGESYSSLEELMLHQCEGNWFDGDMYGGISFGDCDAISGATTGTLYIVENRDENGSEIVSTDGGVWEIKTVNGVEILEVIPNDDARSYIYDDENTIFTVYNNEVYRGEVEENGVEEFPLFNATASNAIKAAIVEFINNNIDTTSDDGSSDENTTTTDDNATVDLVSFLSGNTFYTTIEDIPETLEQWSFNEDLTAADWQELIGGSESGTVSITSVEENSITISDEDGSATLTFEINSPDEAVVTVDDGESVMSITIFRDRYIASAYNGAVADVDISDDLIGKEFYVVGYNYKENSFDIIKVAINDTGDTLIISKLFSL